MRISSSVKTKIDHWAVRQLGDYDARNPGTMFSEGLSLDVASAYQLQTAVSKLRCQRGERVIGYKVGCTSAKIRTQLGIEHCVTGRLYDTEQYPSRSRLPLDQFACLAIEGELAVELSKEPCEDDFREGQLPRCVSRVFPVIELHHHVMRSVPPSAGELIANNAIHAGVVEADQTDSLVTSIGEELNDTVRLSIFVDDNEVEHCQGRELIETIHTSLQWLQQVLKERGDSLRAGERILTGSIPSLIPIQSACQVRVEAPPFGEVEAEFIESETGSP